MGKLVNEYDGKNLDNIRKFLKNSGVKNKVDKIAFDYFLMRMIHYQNLELLIIVNYTVFKFIQERHY